MTPLQCLFVLGHLACSKWMCVDFKLGTQDFVLIHDASAPFPERVEYLDTVDDVVYVTASRDRDFDDVVQRRRSDAHNS